MLQEHSDASSAESVSTSNLFSDLLEEVSDVRLSILKVSNISWDLASVDVIEYLGEVRLAKTHVHIPIDRASGKTRAEMFVEVPTMVEAIRSIAKYNKRILKGRAVTVSLSSMEELYHSHFPSGQDLTSDEFISAADTDSLVAICRNYKAHFSRKCAERPFEHVMSILRLAPWHRMSDRMCERLYLLSLHTIEALAEHLNRTVGVASRIPEMGQIETAPISQLGPDLLARLLSSVKSFPAFSPEQAAALQDAGRRSVPKFGSPMFITVEPKPSRHLRRSSIDHILQELGADKQRTAAVSSVMRDAFEKIMLSSGASSPHQ